MEAADCQNGGRGKEKMTEKLYYAERYLRSISACVVAVSGNAVILDRTIFYPEAGGQPGDRGTFGPCRIADTRKGDDGEILHILEPGSAVPAPGDREILELDWGHRYFFMKTHTAQHLVSALLFSSASIGTVAVHHGEEFFTIETDREELDETLLMRIEDEANDAIRRRLSVWQDEVEHEEAEKLGMRRSIKVPGRVMLVHIDGVDVVACGGVHVSSTSEIGEIVYVSSERLRSHVRTVWKCAEKAVAYRRENAAAVHALSALFSAEPENIVTEAERLLSREKEGRHSLRKMSEKLASLILERELMKTPDGEIVIFISDIGVESYEGAAAGVAAVFIAADRNGRFLYHGEKDGFDALRSAVSGVRGGGREGLYRGSFPGTAEDFTAACRSLFCGNGST